MTILCKNKEQLLAVLSKLEMENPELTWCGEDAEKPTDKNVISDIVMERFPIELYVNEYLYYHPILSPTSPTSSDYLYAEEYLKDAIKDDPVNHPAHYTSGKVECIDAMEQVFGKDAVANYCLGAMFKYLWRRKLKENEEQDIKKSLWYFDKFMELVNK